MKPYYESWKRSSHNNVACVECHIAPGMTAEVRKKYEALSMVVSYFTGTYGTNPWTEVEDAACLRCHQRRLLAGKELFGDVLFDHTAHLSGQRRGKTLRCTSCHSQIVQGSHIAVTKTTCILCHFKGQTSGVGTARCTLCHQVPDRVIRTEGLTFNHKDVERFGMACGGCHARPVGKDGDVPRERCVTCHNDASRLEKYGESDLLHLKHVSEHKVDCMDCHLDIQHVGRPGIEQAALTCASCHERGHSPQLSLYTGVGGRGVEPLPSPMFAAGVRCEGCHLAIPGQKTDTRRASEIACMSCHGPSYRNIFLSWKDQMERRSSALEKQIATTGASLGHAAPATLADARFNLDLVVRGQAVHNVDYARALLSRAHADMNSARKVGGMPPLPAPWKEVPFQSACLQCHQGIEGNSGVVFGRAYRHEPHVVGAGIDCQTCHRPHAEKQAHEVLRFGEEGCESCHHKDAAAACLSCHGGVRDRKIKVSRGEFSHAFHIDDAGQKCADCHELKAGGPPGLKEDHCVECHG